MRRTVDADIEFNAAAEGDVSDFDETARIAPKKVLRMGLQIMNNEMKRLAKQSRASGLNGMQSMVLNQFVRTASEIQKKHKDMNIDFLEIDDLSTVSEEELIMQAVDAMKELKIDITDVVVQRGRRKTIDHES